jgi:Leucine-rich repeat (LRR) protein
MLQEGGHDGGVSTYYLGQLEVLQNKYTIQFRHRWNKNDDPEREERNERNRIMLEKIKLEVGLPPNLRNNRAEMLKVNTFSFEYQGYAPMSLWTLEGLTSLDLHRCNVEVIPSHVSNLINLRSLNLSHNNTLAVLPPELELLTNLTKLNLSTTNVVRMPSIPSLLTYIASVSIPGTNLLLNTDASICPELRALDLKFFVMPEHYWNGGYFPKLENLSLMDAKIVEIPGGFFSCNPQLRELRLNYNALSHLPPSVCSLAQLSALEVNYNQLIDLPPEIFRLTRLKKMEIFSNRFDTRNHIYGNTLRAIMSFYRNRYSFVAKFLCLNQLLCMDVVYLVIKILLDMFIKDYDKAW